MKKLVSYILLLIPCLCSGQLFPKMPELKGDIEKIVEKKYGKEVNFLGWKGVYHPKAYSGWKYTYLFDENSNLIKRTNTYYGKIDTEFIYQRDTIENRFIEREIITESDEGLQGNYIEYENFKDPAGQLMNTNYWSYNAKDCTREMFQTEHDAEYLNGKLFTFIRQNIKLNGETDLGEKCTLTYDSSGLLTRIERLDLGTGLKNILYYTYNKLGFAEHYSVDYLVGLDIYGKNPKQDIFYKYDRRGNWILMYWNSDNKTRVEVRRSIRYR